MSSDDKFKELEERVSKLEKLVEKIIEHGGSNKWGSSLKDDVHKDE